MIRISIDLDSAFGSHRDRHLGDINIINDATGTRTRGNYDVEFIDAKGRVFKRRRVEDHARLAESIWKLIEKAVGREEGADGI